MDRSSKDGLLDYEHLVEKRFNVYNSLFLNLPYDRTSLTGEMIPVLYRLCVSGLEAGERPDGILEDFFIRVAQASTEEEQIDLLFKIIQYVERQVVLFDSVEDAAFQSLKRKGHYLAVTDFFELSDSRKDWAQVKEFLEEFRLRIVLTAHPTQFYPLSVLNTIKKLQVSISEDDISAVDTLIQQLGLTSLLNDEKPSPVQEARNIIYFLRYVYYDAIGEFFQEMKRALDDPEFSNHDLLGLGFWPGGDRDGNPFVTAETTWRVSQDLRMTLMKCYYNEVKELRQKLTFKGVDRILRPLRDKLYKAMFDEDFTLTTEDILTPLKQAWEISQNVYHGVHAHHLSAFIDKVSIFRTHFACLDIRQDHRIHHGIIEDILKSKSQIESSLDELSKDDLEDLLLRADFSVEPDDCETDIAKDTLRNIQQLKEIQASNGVSGCHRYIISNSESPYSVLYVLALFRWSGYDINALDFDIIPLFETMGGMDGAEATMEVLFATQEYRLHLEHRLNRQTIMLGFSDGTKDGGYLKANWAIYKTKERLTACSIRNDIKAIFFDGRGGPPARGGGKTHRFYASQGPDIANHEIQLTIQGQTISSTYGTEAQFKYNSEQMLTAGLSTHFTQDEPGMAAEHRQIIEELSEISYHKYMELKSHPKFIPYLERKSTLKYYGKANVGSRPTKRGLDRQLTLDDLRAISFVGSWSQLKQNVPGYYGIGWALKSLVDDGRLEELKDLFIEAPFFKALIMNCMMSLSKCYFALTSYIADEEEFRDFWHMLHDEFILSKEMLLLISGYDELMQEEPSAKKSIAIRERIVLPLLVVQQYALQKLQQGTERTEAYEKLVTRSLYGNVNASRNSA
jgi:phosphoenolpyruvate carboxylase